MSGQEYGVRGRRRLTFQTNATLFHERKALTKIFEQASDRKVEKKERYAGALTLSLNTAEV